MTTDELLDLVRTYAMERYPRASAVQIIITIPQAEPVTLCVPAFCGEASRETTLETGGAHQEHPSITRTERRILKAVADLETDDPIAEEIAEAAKLPFGSHLQKTLTSMRVKGLLGGHKRDVGYPITPLGLEIIEPENA